eukprot:GILK01010182.1.p1 GENE.GILK01010182.1~~GILK01010182.1.p1  ORF type:complete len:169 (-),score=21.00 GILK01010182.1:69-533(-)
MELGLPMQDVIDHTSRVEALAEDILLDRQQMIDFDRKRNANREALGFFRRGDIPAGSKQWVCAGDFFIKMSDQHIKTSIQHDQAKLDSEIDTLRRSIKEKTRTLISLNPSVTDMHPGVVDLLVREQQQQPHKSGSSKTHTITEEDEDDIPDSDS